MTETMNEGYSGLEIAVIGMAGRFPGARNINEFWDNLKNGIESISFFSDQELVDAGVTSELLQNPNYVKANGIMEDIKCFDAPFFGYTPKEAEITDPQIRIFHECVWAALEDAGYDPGAYKGLIGLYAGATHNFSWQVRALLSGKANEIGNFAAAQLIQRDYLTLRISYKLDLKGPSFILYTACSTSLVAIHLACQAILNGECDMALAGGVTAIRLDIGGYIYQEGMVGSPDGHCKTFDAGSKGFVGGDGAGVVVLKRLEDAVFDKDHIFAVIKGSAINNDGIRKAGFSAPSVEGQAAVVKMAMQIAEVAPESIGYIETHGTATQLGDPVELEGLQSAFNTDKKGFCAVGSVKSNVGHTDSAAGVTGFIKTVLALKHRLIPPTLHFEIPNLEIDFINSPFFVNSKLTVWGNGKHPLRAGVSSFGQGGTNAHVILENWMGTPPPGLGCKYHLIALSAKNPAALDKMTKNITDYFKKNPGTNLADAAYTLQLGRRPFKYRKVFVCAGIDEAIKILSSSGSDNIYTGVVEEGGACAGTEESTDDLVCLVKGSHKTDSGLYELLEKIGHLWINGANVDWPCLHSNEKRYRLSLPSYPFEKTPYWIDRVPFKTVEPQAVDSLEASHRRPEKKEIKYPRPELRSRYVAPASETEKELAEIWQRFFGFERIGIRDDFFELGGDSLKVIMLVSMIQKDLNVRVPIPEFFDRPTIEKLSQFIREIPSNIVYVPLEPTEKKEYYELSSAQKRMFIFHQINENSISYNTPFVLGLKLEVEVERIEQGFKRLIKRHETLRNSFLMLPDGPVQVVHDDVPFNIEYYESGEEEVLEIITNFIRPFDLGKAPVLRVGLIKTGQANYVLMVDMYHIISDAFSFGVLVNDFMALYEEQDLPPLEIQYKDFSQWQKRLYESGVMEKQKKFWGAGFEDGDIPLLNIPLDYPRPPVRNIDKGDLLTFVLDEALREKIYIILSQTETTLPMVLFAVYFVLLFVYTKQEDIVVGMLSSGRSHADLGNIIGMFVNTLPVRSYPQKNKTFADFLKEIKEMMLLAYENQDYPFDELIVDLGLQGGSNRNPLFDVVFAYNTFDNRRIKTGKTGKEYPDRKVIPYGPSVKFAKFDLYLQVNEVGETLGMMLRYSTQLFKPSTIEKIKKYYIEILEQVVDDITVKLGDITLSHGLTTVTPRVQRRDELDFNL